MQSRRMRGPGDQRVIRVMRLAVDWLVARALPFAMTTVVAATAWAIPPETSAPTADDIGAGYRQIIGRAR
jgi:hypothetical protein